MESRDSHSVSFLPWYLDVELFQRYECCAFMQIIGQTWIAEFVGGHSAVSASRSRLSITFHKIVIHYNLKLKHLLCSVTV